MKAGYSYLSFFFLILFSGVNAQTIDNWIIQNEKVPVEKIYLHTDKEFYFNGEIIWFKAYLSDSRSGKLIPGAENIYVSLIDDKGNQAIKSILMSVNGQVAGSISLPDTLKPGNYLIQAFTDYLMNFSSDAFFYKPVNVSRVGNSARLNQNQQRFNRSQSMVADVSILPEGGSLLENVSNLVAFKAVNRDGYGVEAKGLVRDEKGNTVVEFSTDYKGMGLFFFTPETGKKYTAKINGFPSFNYKFDSVIVGEGVKIQVVNHTSSELIINVASNSEKFTGSPFYLVNMYRGEVIFYQAFKTEGINHVLKFNSENLRGGINRLVLLNKELVPVSERLLFSNNFEVINLQVNSDSQLYNNRSLVNVKVAGENEDSSTGLMNLSVSVLHENAIPQGGLSMNMLSWLLIDSELKGFVEASTDYFTDTGIDSRAKLRLLMLTNGWKSYFWNTVPGASENLIHQQKAGLDFKGTAINNLSETPLQNGEITMIIKKDGEMAVLTQYTNEKGEFTFPGLLFNDTAGVYIQAKNEKGRMNTDISLSPVFLNTVPSEKLIAGLNSFYDTPYELQRQKYYGDLALREYDPSYRTRNINQVDVVEDKMKDTHFRIYDKADQVLEVPVNETSHSNVLDFMVGKVAGLDINADDVRIRGTSSFGDNSTPLFLIDGVPVNQETNMNLPTEVGLNTSGEAKFGSRNVLDMIKSVPLGDIEKVEILKSPQNLSYFGTEGANGVIAIYTRHGQVDRPNQVLKGLLERKIAGYASYRKFYSPEYSPGEMKNPSPDFRTVLYWNPEVTAQKGSAGIDFYTSDQTGNYIINVEGITSDGKVCLGSAGFQVVPENEN